jgi:hypothetical protein
MSYSELPIFFPADGREGWVFLCPPFSFFLLSFIDLVANNRLL